MRFRLLMILLFAGLSYTFAQEYPLVTIHDIQYIDSVGTKGFIQSPFTGDTVRVRGVVTVRPLVDPDTARQPILYLGARWGSYIQDTSSAALNGWGGLNILQNDTTGANQNTFFDLVDTSDVIEITGVVTKYGQTNELMILLNPVTPVNPIGKLDKRPDPVQLSVTDFMNNLQEVKEAFKYSGMYVELHNLISANRNTSTGQFNAYDANGNYVIVYPQSRYYRLDKKLPYSTYQVPADGTPISTLRGIVSVYNDVFEILPIYPNDIVIKAIPPVISNVKRSPLKVETNQPDTVTAKVVDLTAHLTSVKLNYRIEGQSRVAVEMTKMQNDTTMYYGVIPGIGQDSTLVDYFITAEDDSGLVGYTPSDTVKSNYFYQVLNAPLKIRDIQYSPFGSGYSAYNGSHVTLTGIVTADTSDIPGFGSTPLRVYMQDGDGPWTGIMIGTSGLKGVEVLDFKRGDSVTLTGTIVENYSVTSIDSLSNIVINSHNNTLPEPIAVATGTIGKSASGVVAAEQWESVLIKYENITVTDDNADGDSGPVTNNYGEIYVNDGTGDTRVELQDGNHNYENFWDANLPNDPNNIQVTATSTMLELRGVLFFSFSYYKLTPRKDDDFVDFVTDVEQDNSSLPKSFELSQNYPNPFNPSTVIRYSIPNASNVSLKIYNLLGQEVKTLVSATKAPGTYDVSFNASELSSGIYFYSLRAGNFYQVKKMMLLK